MPGTKCTHSETIHVRIADTSTRESLGKTQTPGCHRVDKSFCRSSGAATHDTAVVETSASPAGEPLLIVWYCEWDEGRTNARMLAIIPLMQSVW